MRALAVLAALMVFLAVPSLLAHSAPRAIEGTLSGLPPGPTKRFLLDVRAFGRASAVDAVAYEPFLEEAIRALERARGARAAGDDKHAGLLERVGAEWARAAELSVRARVAERASLLAQEAAKEQARRVERARGLLEENQAHRGRLEAQWRQASSRQPSPTGTAVKPVGPSSVVAPLGAKP